MSRIFFYIFTFIVLGAAGMWIANRTVDKQISRQRWLKYVSYLVITGVVVTAIFLSIFRWIAAIIIVVGFLEIIQANVSGKRKNHTAVSILIYTGLAAGFYFFAIRFNPAALFFIYFQVLIFDAFCQITGQIFGRHALVPSISQGKTTEGLWGGWLFCILAALLNADAVGISVFMAMLIGILTGLTSFCGDILASYFKRMMGMKDYSNWLPGQGGFLDRFDSLLMTGAIYYILGVTILNNSWSKFMHG